MITLYSGTPGSGKSYRAMALILRMLHYKKFVISNFPVKFTEKEIKKGYDKRFCYWQNANITIESLIEFALDQGMIEKKTESQAVVVYDEAGGIFNCREFGRKDRAEWIDFFSQHRKIGYDFVLITQNDRMLDRQIRGFIEYEVRHRKVNNFGVFSFLPFTLFVAVEYWYSLKQRVGCYWSMYNSGVASHYDHMRTFEGFKISPVLLKKIEVKRQGLDVPLSSIFNSDKEDGE